MKFRTTANRRFRRRPKHQPFGLRTVLWAICSIIVVAAGVFVLILHKPADYVQPEPIKDRQVSKYLTHVLSRDLYNGTQQRQPFNLVISQDGINDIVARLKWPQETGGISILVPEIVFEPNTIILRGIVESVGLQLLVTIRATAFTDEDGLLNLLVRNVKFGAVNVTAPAKAIAKGLYENELEQKKIKPGQWSDKIFAAILKNKPFEPILKIEDKHIRIETVDIIDGEMTLYMIPVEMDTTAEVRKEQPNG